MIGFFLLLFYSVYSDRYLNISSDSDIIFKQEDILTSTLGYYKLTLINPNCGLMIQKFNNGNYSHVGTYKKLTKNCSTLKVSNGKLMGQNDLIF